MHRIADQVPDADSRRGKMGTDSCDVAGAAFFVAALVAGTGCTICSKALFQVCSAFTARARVASCAPMRLDATQVRSIGMTGEEETFKPAIFQTFVMFLGMSFALPAYFIGEARKRAAAANDPDRLLELQAAAAKITARTYALLAVPSVLDLLATCLMLIGLQYVNASVWMLLRGGGIVFVALMKNYFLRDVLQAAPCPAARALCSRNRHAPRRAFLLDRLTRRMRAARDVARRVPDRRRGRPRRPCVEDRSERGGRR